MVIKLNERVTHDGEVFEPGKMITKIKDEQAERLVNLGVASFVETVQVQDEDPPEGPPVGDNLFEGIELAELKDAAKEVGVEFSGNIGLETLIKRIEEEGKTEAVLSQFEEGEE